jgi:hypothetical protein
MDRVMSTDIEFQPWPKIARLNRDIIVTEKIDGTNAAVLVLEDGRVAAQSRKRLITPEDDNFGFARWVAENAGALSDVLGAGRHFGEWWGSGIQRGYGLTNGEKRFSLFNTVRYGTADLSSVDGLSTTPVLYSGAYDQFEQEWLLDELVNEGSVAAPGFMDPEGIVVFHTAAQQMFKVTIKGDEAPKSLAVAS